MLLELGVKQTRGAGTPAQAFAMVQEHPADLVLTDWAPGLDGVRLVEMLRKDTNSPDPCVPVIMVTAFTAMSQICVARDVGISEFLAKPITANLIYRRIKTLIEHPRPFVRKGTYFGPDRRRHDQHHTSVERRARVANGTNGPEVISVEEVLRASADARAKSKADNDD